MAYDLDVKTYRAPVYVYDTASALIIKMFQDSITHQTRLDIITSTAVNQPASLRLWYNSTGVGTELYADPAGSGVTLDSWKNAADTMAIRLRTLNAAGNNPLDRILIKGLADAGSGSIQFQEPITKWDVGNARVGLHINAQGGIDFLNGCYAGNYAHICAIWVKAGAPVDADFTNPFVGLIVLDTATPKLWIRTAAATWKGVAIA